MRLIIKSLFICTLMFASLTSSAGDCYKEPANAEQGKNIGGFDKQSAIKNGYSKLRDPVKELGLCAYAVTGGGMNPKTVIGGICGCKEALNKLCSVKRGVIKAKGGASLALCLPFAPVLL